jgi:hypothetical protein
LFTIEARPILPREVRSGRGVALVGAAGFPVVGAAPLSRAELFAHARSVLAPLAFTDNAKQIFASIGYFESRYGLADNFLMPDGSPSFNWGALVGKGPAGSVITNDHDKAGNLVKGVPFMAFFDAPSGLRKFLEVLIHPGTGQELPAIAEANAGDARALATRMYKNGYYGGFGSTDQERIDGYVSAIVGNARDYAKAIGQPLLVTGTGGTAPTYIPAGTGDAGLPVSVPVANSSSSGGVGVGLLVAAGLGLVAWKVAT